MVYLSVPTLFWLFFVVIVVVVFYILTHNENHVYKTTDKGYRLLSQGSGIRVDLITLDCLRHPGSMSG